MPPFVRRFEAELILELHKCPAGLVVTVHGDVAKLQVETAHRVMRHAFAGMARLNKVTVDVMYVVLACDLMPALRAYTLA